jgi:hypothetical protein
MLIKTSNLEGAALDWAVAGCEKFKPHAAASLVIMGEYSPSTNWAQGGPIIERELLEIMYDFGDKSWYATKHLPDEMVMCYGLTPLIAAMRCYVASKIGDTIEIPNELLD